MSYVERAWIAALPDQVWLETVEAGGFITHQTNPEQSKPPATGEPSGDCGCGEVPPQMYGMPAYRSARPSTLRLSGDQAGSCFATAIFDCPAAIAQGDMCITW